MSMLAAARSRRPKLWGQRIQLGRHAVQLAFAGFIASVVIQNGAAGEGATVGASPEAFCPLGGFEGLYQWATSGGRFVQHTHASNLILAGAVVLSALFAGAFFCGWVCTFGALQEAIGAFSRRLQRRLPPFGRAMRALRRAVEPLATVDRVARWFRYLVLAWILLGTALAGALVFRDVDPWYALLTVARFELAGGGIVLAVVVLASFFLERPWCRYACPLGAVAGTVGLLSPVKIERDAAACLACDVCTKDCPMGIDVHTVTRVSSPQCIACLECVSACPTNGGLQVRLVLPGVRPAPQTAGLSPVLASERLVAAAREGGWS